MFRSLRDLVVHLRQRSLHSSFAASKARTGVGRNRIGNRDRSFSIETLEDRTVPASTAQLLADLAPGANSSYPRDMMAFGSKMVLSAGDLAGNLFISDGTAAGTKRIDPPGRTLTNVADFEVMGSYAYFTAKDVLPNGTSEYGIELWRTDGTPLGTTLVKDVAPGEGNSTPRYKTAVGDKLYFVVTNPINGQDSSLWVTDGNAAGTHLVKDINPNGTDSVYISKDSGRDAVLGNLLFFRAATTNQIANFQIWRTDGTEAGTFAVTADPNGFIYPSLTAFGGKMYWGGSGKINYTDGTVAGTGAYGAFVGSTFSLTNLGDKLAYVAASFVSGGNYSVWTTTGANAGTQKVILDTDYRWYGADIWKLGDKVLLQRNGADNSGFYSADIFTCNLTNFTYSPVQSLVVENHNTRIDMEVVAGSTMYFLASSSGQFFNSTYRWYQTDGTAAGTVPVLNGIDGKALEAVAGYGAMASANGELFLNANSTGIGTELFKIGTPVGLPAAPTRSDIIGRYNEAGQWYVGVSNGTSFATAYWGTWSPGVAWVDVQSGDFNGDGKMDVVGRYAAAGQWYVGLSNGSSFVTSLWATWSPGVTWADMKVGDFNRDGRDDIVGRWKEGGQWYVGLSTGASFSTSLWATWSAGVTWTDVAVGDFNGDGREDIVGRWAEGGQWYVGLSNESKFATSYFATWTPGLTWADVQVADLNGDGRTDLIGRLASTGEWYAGISNGSSFATGFWGLWSVINWVDVRVGDFNGDGKADIAGRWKETGQWYVGTSTGSALTTTYWGAWSSGATWVDVKVGDFDGDGKTDIVGRHKEAGQWYVGKSSGSSFTNQLWATWSAGATWADCHAANDA